jgi:hypothetical protein
MLKHHEKILQIMNDSNITFNVGLNKDEKGEMLVTFYDARYKKNFGKYGQSIATYYADTLLGKDDWGKSIAGVGLNLYGGVDDWYITGSNATDVTNFIEENTNE